MKRRLKISLTLLAISLCCLTTLASQLPERGAASQYFEDKSIDRKVEKLLKKMTTEEKIGQLVLYPGKGTLTGPQGKFDTEDYIKRGLCGSVFNVRDVEEVITLQRLAIEESRLSIPLLFGFDVIHGYRTIFPVNLAISSTWDMALVERSARISAEEASVAGVNWTFSPMCDISHDPRWGRVSEGAGEDPYLGGCIAAAMVKGYQGDDLSAPNTILACVKHFAAYGAAQAGRDYHTVDMSERMLRDIYLPPYQAGVDAGAATVMASFNEYDGVPATASKFLMDKLLREEMGFGGFIVSDYTGVAELIPHGVAHDLKHAAELAINAQVNMDMVSSAYAHYGERLVEEGLISMELLDKMCGEVLAMKYRLGLFDDPYRYCAPEKIEQVHYREDFMEDAATIAKSSMVLLENKNETLPVARGSKIALIGPFGNSGREMLGSWVIMSKGARSSTFLKGLRDVYGVDNVSFTQGCKFLEPMDGGFEAARKAAEEADVVMLTLGLPFELSGEAASLTSIQLPEVQRQLLDEVKSVGKPVVILLVTARPMDLSREQELSDAILLTWHPGVMAAKAIGEVVSGEYNPSGKLTMTFPRNIGQIPIHYNMKNTGRPLGLESMSSQKYTSRYVFTSNTPLYPFGYGLSYTTFSYSDIKVKSQSVAIGESITVEAKVTNSGKVAGEEVAQLYIQDRVGSVTRPVRELKGFEKISLKSGESQVVEFTLTPDDLSFWRGDMTFGQEAGEYNVWVGTNSDATLGTTFTIKN